MYATNAVVQEEIAQAMYLGMFPDATDEVLTRVAGRIFLRLTRDIDFPSGMIFTGESDEAYMFVGTGKRAFISKKIPKTIVYDAEILVEEGD